MPTQNQKRQRQKMGRQARQAALLAARKRRARRNRAIVSGFLALLLVAGILTLFGGGGGDDNEVATTDTTAVPGAPVELPPAAEGEALTGDTECPPAGGAEKRTTKFAKPPPMCIDPAKKYTAEIRTNFGTMVVELNAASAPKTVNNFVVLARYHYFDGISFHRIIPGFVIQGGDPLQTGTGDPGYKFEDELPQQGQYKVGSLAMANSGPNTNGSQFFIITGEQGVALPPQYSLFGQVIEGQDVVTKIDAVGSPNSAEGKPTAVVTMESVTIKEA